MNWLENILVQCPQCGEEFAIQIETVVEGRVEMIEDCAICCRPALVQITIQGGQISSIEVEAA